MKTWQQFNDAVIELLLTDGARRGLGVEKYRDRMIVAGVRDLQRHIPELRTTPSTLGWTSNVEVDITGATNPASPAPIVITSTGHSLTSGDSVVIAGVTGNTAANGTFVITVVNTASFSLTGSTGNGDYVSGGTWILTGTTKLTPHGEGKCEVGSFDYEGTRVLDVVVRRLPTEDNNQSASVYYRPHVLPGHRYYEIIDGGGRDRTNAYPGRISFRLGKFYSSPTLRADETLTILFNSEKVYLPLNLCVDDNAAEATAQTPLTDDAVLAVHHFVKYHFAKDVDDNQKLAASNYDLFKNIRRSIFANKQEIPGTSDATIPAIGDGVIP